MNVRRFIAPTPARIGTNVRTTGTNRARTIVFAPCGSKNSSVRSMYSCLKSRESGRRKIDGPDLRPERVAHLVPDDRSHEAPDEDDREVQVALLGEEARGEQQRVAGEEEAEQQPDLGEDDEHQPDVAEGPRIESPWGRRSARDAEQVHHGAG